MVTLTPARRKPYGLRKTGATTSVASLSWAERCGRVTRHGCGEHEGTNLTEILLVGSGSFLGGSGRYLLATFVANRWGAGFPFGTLVINATGSLLIGVVLTYILARANLSPSYRLVFVIGFLGSYTTFSSYTFDALTLMQNGEWLKSLTYLLGTMVLGMIAVTIGMLLGRTL